MYLVESRIREFCNDKGKSVSKEAIVALDRLIERLLASVVAYPHKRINALDIETALKGRRDDKNEPSHK